ncbi:MAG: tetratricopeptide repeat protein [Lentisphaeria bacterium]|nr:tetratricopeptide repeat protein [Lentisphaeria bacterium]
MAITKITYQQLAPAVRSVYGKAREVIKQGNLEYGITLLKDIVLACPGFEEARNDLRAAEKAKTAGMNAVAKFFASLRQSGDITKGTLYLKKDPMEALKYAEEAAAKVLNKKALLFFADAAMELEEYDLAIQSYDFILAGNKDDEEVLLKLLEPLTEKEDHARIVKVRQYFATKYPRDLEKQHALREAAALASLGTAKFVDDGSSKSNIPGSSAPKTDDLEKGDRIIRSEEDIRELISRYEKNINAGQATLDNYRKVAELYYRVNRFQDAINAYNALVKLQGNLDPVIDREIEKATVALSGVTVKRLEIDHAPAEEIQAEKDRILAYRVERAESRVTSYPNDLQMRYELALIYWELADYDRALEQFQQARRNPQRKLMSIVYLGRCLSAKGQFDMALDQFDAALAEMPVMDKSKMQALYYKGEALSGMGRVDEAFECYKQIYSTDVGFLDVGRKVEEYYASKKAQA